jgi:hypothetical protein
MGMRERERERERVKVWCPVGKKEMKTLHANFSN